MQNRILKYVEGPRMIWEGKFKLKKTAEKNCLQGNDGPTMLNKKH